MAKLVRDHFRILDLEVLRHPLDYPRRLFELSQGLATGVVIKVRRAPAQVPLPKPQNEFIELDFDCPLAKFVPVITSGLSVRRPVVSQLAQRFATTAADCAFLLQARIDEVLSFCVLSNRAVEVKQRAGGDFRSSRAAQRRNSKFLPPPEKNKNCDH